MRRGTLGARVVLGATLAAVPALTLAGAQPAQAIGVVPSVTAKLVGTVWGDPLIDLLSLDALGRNDPRKDAGSLHTVTTAIGARTVWGMQDAKGRAITGQGVTVALLDSGLAPVAGLNGTGKVIKGPDLSLESGGTLGPDTFGHGTHLAGIIGAKDAVEVAPNGMPRASDPKAQFGVAPDAKILALKLAATDGSTDVSQVIAALDWVTQHRNDDGMNVRVVNLSFGTAALQPYQVDPLAAAAENAWKKGLVVVVSGGNTGTSAASLTNPAIDPYVIAVGASEAKASVTGWATPSVASFSARGTAERHVDLVAPGKSIVSLRDPGSYVDTNFTSGRVTGDPSGRLFRGSGTSQAAAVTSGAVALLLQAYPQLTPDQVKAVLTGTATPVLGATPVDAGAGQLNVAAAVSALTVPKTAATLLGRPAQAYPAATASGTLDKARGGSYLYFPGTQTALTGEVDVQGRPWTGTSWLRLATRGTSWDGGSWNGATWTGAAWTSTGWAGARWSGTTWTSARWADVAWDSARWASARWAGSTWDSARWAGNVWS